MSRLNPSPAAHRLTGITLLMLTTLLFPAVGTAQSSISPERALNVGLLTYSAQPAYHFAAGGEVDGERAPFARPSAGSAGATRRAAGLPSAPDGDRYHDPDPHLHEPGADGREKGSRPPQRPVQPRLRVVREPERTAAVHRTNGPVRPAPAYHR